MIITEGRLQELEKLGREAYPFRAELASLCEAYRERNIGLKVIKNKDGVWLHFCSPSGKTGIVHLDTVKDGRGPLVVQTLEEWGESL